MPKKPDILNTHIVAKSRLFTIEDVHLRFANGEERHFERLAGRRRGAVMMVPLLEDNDTVLLVREYAVGLERYDLGLPKGLLEDDEDVLAAANRELQEEVGYGARQLEPLKSLATAPGYLHGFMHTVLARDLFEARLPGDEPEPLEVVPWRLSELPDLIAREDFCEARSVATLYMVKDLLSRGEI
jgi:ADP compounds hydrolase